MGRARIAATLTAAAGFPWHTFAANGIGSVAIGLI
jgi:fluoride ion exporter CrcB/FEX